MTNSLTLDLLRSSIQGGAVAIRRVQRLQPAGGAGDKVFPPTYEGGQYAAEERCIDGARIPCVLLDSVQSQANRMELALKEAFYHGRQREADIPIVTVDFAAEGLPEVGEITSLDAPHRLADAILRDSMSGDRKFRESDHGKVLDSATIQNASGVYGACPTALVFGLWDSTGPRGGLGTKFQRALVGEIVGINTQAGVRPSSRLDPLGIQLNAGPVFEAKDGSGWTTDPSLARTEKNKPVVIGKDGKPSEINHGNVTPSLKSDKGLPHHGGVTLAYAQQTVVLSLPALRRLRFPTTGGELVASRDLAARTALAALAIAAAEFAIRQGCDLRSRCLLVPDAQHPAAWELLDADGHPTTFSLSDPRTLVTEAAAAAEGEGLPAWRSPPVVLRPSPELVSLVRKSREKLVSAAPE